jgi:hypothetical protein
MGGPERRTEVIQLSVRIPWFGLVLRFKFKYHDDGEWS